MSSKKDKSLEKLYGNLLREYGTDEREIKVDQVAATTWSSMVYWLISLKTSPILLPSVLYYATVHLR